MDNERTVKAWQGSIVLECENRLGRKLTTSEETFITAREGFIALEIIEDTVKSKDRDELVEYLNSESKHNDYNNRE